MKNLIQDSVRGEIRTSHLRNKSQKIYRYTMFAR